MAQIPHIRFRDVALRFPGQPHDALTAITLDIPRGQVLTVLGPSGCGKTTMMRMIAGLVRPDHGEVLVDGRPPEVGRDSALVFQNFRLLPWKTVAENVAFACHDLPRPRQQARVAECLALVGLSRFGQHHPRQLSGGMQQRVALARALAADPAILLMDEPFASLDAQSRELMQDEVLRLSRRSAEGAPRTVVFITHSVDEALVLGDRVLLLSPRPGRMAALVDLPFARAGGNPRLHPDFARLREDLWSRLRDMVLSDPQSDFHGRSAMSQSV